MIHLHTMFSSENNTSTSGQKSNDTLSQSGLTGSRLDSFHGALSDAVSSTLEKFGIHPNDVKISITRASAAATPPSTTSKDTSARTAPPTPGSSTPGSGSTSTASSQAPNNGYDPFLQAAVNNPYSSTPTQSTQPPIESSSTPLDPQQAFDQAYWAEQPTAVQALQNIQDPEQRAAMATQLANEGYSIDVPIMVWGWDPSITTAMREADGYTWVPSALQNPVEMAPGLPSMGTLAAYDPNNPPPGSIMVGSA